MKLLIIFVTSPSIDVLLFPKAWLKKQMSKASGQSSVSGVV